MDKEKPTLFSVGDYVDWREVAKHFFEKSYGPGPFKVRGVRRLIDPLDRLDGQKLCPCLLDKSLDRIDVEKLVHPQFLALSKGRKHIGRAWTGLWFQKVLAPRNDRNQLKLNLKV